MDAGLSTRETLRRLDLIGEKPDHLNGILVSHEHSDHVAGLERLARKFRIPIYISRLTAPALGWNGDAPQMELFQAGASFSIGDIDIASFTIPHDAIDPVGFLFRAEGVRMGVVTDLGYITDSIRFHTRGADLLVLESNHDLDMLKVGPYPWAVKQRVMSRVGHLSNAGMCDFIRDDLDSATAHLILGHLSEHNNHPEIVRLVASQTLAERALTPRLTVAQQKNVTEVFEF